VGLNLYALLFWDDIFKPQWHSLLSFILPFHSLYEPVVRNRGLIPEIPFDAMRFSIFVGTEVYWLSLGIVAGLVLAWPLSLIRIRNQPIIQFSKEQ
jgi:hypothetical protein